MIQKAKVFFVFLLVMFVNTGCAVLQTVPTQIISYEGVYLKDLCERYGLELEWDSVSQVILLHGDNVDVRAMVGSEAVIVGDARVMLSEPIRTVNSAIVVPGDFRKLVIERKVRTVSALRTKSKKNKRKHTYEYSKIRTVFVDAGHGGKDPGALGRTGLYEKDVVLDVAKRLRKSLKKKGFKVVMSRDKDFFVPLSERTEIVSMSKADIFISIHANSNPRRSINGAEVYLLKRLSFIEKNEDQRNANYRKMYKSINMQSEDETLCSIVTDLYDLNKQPESMKLAECVTTEMKETLRTRNRGIKKARFYVLRNTLIPALLVEVGYLSNPKEERLLRTKSYRQEVADSIARGVVKYGQIE